MNAGEMAVTDFCEVHPFTGTKTVADQLTDNGFLVIKNEATVFGIITTSDYIRKPHSLVIDCIDPKPEIGFDDNLENILDIFTQSGQPALPVYRGALFHGVLTPKIILQKMADFHQDWVTTEKYEETLREKKILVAGIGHDFRNLLNIMIGGISASLRHDKDPQVSLQALQKAEQAALAAKKLSRQLLLFSEETAPLAEVIDLGAVLEESIPFYTNGSGVSLHFESQPGLFPVSGNIAQMNQVFHNLTINAIQAMPDGGQLTVRLDRTRIDDKNDLPVKSGDYVRIQFEDSGNGIPKKYHQKIFDPKFTTKPKGTGLGLSIVYNIVSGHRGHITVSSEGVKGTTFTIYLPVVTGLPDSQVNQDTLFSSIEHKTDQKRILLIDDNTDILDVTGKFISHLGHRVETATSSSTAQALYKKSLETQDPFDVVLLDLEIPGDVGGEIIMQQLLAIDPHIKGVITSGYPDHPVVRQYRDFGFTNALCKPYAYKELKDLIDGCN